MLNSTPVAHDYQIKMSSKVVSTIDLSMTPYVYVAGWKWDAKKK